MNHMHVKALAKINLGLDVTGIRETDGYHLVRMVMQTIDLYDWVTLDKNDSDRITLETNLNFLPVDEHNIAYKAAALLKERFPQIGGLHINIHKCIPVAAGMAGGSTDAAAVLFGVNRLFELGLTKTELMAYGLTLGADVPYCLLRGTALAEGIGEELTRIPPMPDCYILIAKPPVSVSTKLVYQELDSLTDLTHPDIDGIMEAIRAQDLKLLCERMENILEYVTIPMHPEIADIKGMMKEYGALAAMMSGSGPTVFGIFDSEEKIRQAKEKLKESGIARQVYITRPFDPAGSYLGERN